MMVHDIYLRGCERCRIVFWFFPAERKTDCKQCGHETTTIVMPSADRLEDNRFKMEID